MIKYIRKGLRTTHDIDSHRKKTNAKDEVILMTTVQREVSRKVLRPRKKVSFVIYQMARKFILDSGNAFKIITIVCK